jgi:uncharacterized protein involved in exopolysaccharide biosynthesis
VRQVLREELARVMRPAAAPKILWQTALHCFIAAVIAAGASFLLPKTYRATVRILPAFSSSIGGFGDLMSESGLGGVLELTAGRRENPVQTFPEILLGQPVLERTLNRHYPPQDPDSANTVMSALHIKSRDPRERAYRGRRKLLRMVEVNANPRTAIITVSVEARDSVLAAYVANSLIDELGRFNVEARKSQSKAVREFVSGRLTEAKSELSRSEASLASFRESNLRIGNSPQLLLEQTRLERQVAIQSDIYRLLSRQYELSRIEEYRDTPTFSVLEPALPPFKKHKPQTLLNSLWAALGVGALSMIWAYRMPLFHRGGSEISRPSSLP